MGIFGTTIGLVLFFLFLFDCGRRLSPGKRSGYFRWIMEWAVKGLAVPIALWVLFDAGLFDCLPTFTPAVENYKLAGNGFAAFVYAGAVGLFFVGSYWAAVTSGWLLAVLWQRTEEQQKFKRCVLVCSIFLGPLAALLTRYFGWGFAGVSGTLWFAPIIQRVLCLEPEQVIKPIYSKAIAKLNFDKHEEAEAAVLEELEKCEDDFDGWLLLAELYASHFHDVAGAEKIIRQTCEHPSTNASQVAVAFHRLADWHLNVARDPAAARRDLWEICRRHPKSHLDHMARVRLEQIPSSREELIERQTPKAVSLPARLEASDISALTREQAQARALRCVEQLKKNPDNAGQREDLARLFAEHLDAVDRGLEQLELLLAMPDAPEAKAAQWLWLMAAWQLKYKQDQPSARKFLERITQRYPKTPQGFSAQTRISLMDAEARMRSRLSQL